MSKNQDVLEIEEGRILRELMDVSRQRDSYRRALRDVILMGLELVKEPSPENLEMFREALLLFPEELRDEKNFSEAPSSIVEIESLFSKVRGKGQPDASEESPDNGLPDSTTDRSTPGVV